jgi:ParB/RepB/Spo0J family partition protein
MSVEVPERIPKAGTQISADSFHVSELNVRVRQSFGESEADKALIEQLRRGKIIGPFRARPEGNGYGVYVGRRRFLAKKEVGTKFFVVGQDCIIDNMSDYVAREASLIENLQIFRQEMDPITRARVLVEIIDHSMIGLRGVARKLGIPPSNLSEWTKVLELTPRMQKAAAGGSLQYTDALVIARMKLGELQQDKLAEILEVEGLDAFQRELAKLTKHGRKRGSPKDKYVVLRATFDKVSKSDMYIYEKLSELAKARRMKIDEYSKSVLTEHINEMFARAHLYDLNDRST